MVWEPPTILLILGAFHSELSYTLHNVLEFSHFKYLISRLQGLIKAVIP